MRSPLELLSGRRTVTGAGYSAPQVCTHGKERKDQPESRIEGGKNPERPEKLEGSESGCRLCLDAGEGQAKGQEIAVISRPSWTGGPFSESSSTPRAERLSLPSSGRQSSPSLWWS